MINHRDLAKTYGAYADHEAIEQGVRKDGMAEPFPKPSPEFVEEVIFLLISGNSV